MLRVAEWLRAAGVTCRFAVRNLDVAGGVVRAAGFEVLQAPLARVEPISGPDGPQPVTVGDIMGSIGFAAPARLARSEEHTSELQSLMRISYAVFCLKKKNKT